MPLSSAAGHPAYAQPPAELPANAIPNWAGTSRTWGRRVSCPWYVRHRHRSFFEELHSRRPDPVSHARLFTDRPPNPVPPDVSFNYIAHRGRTRPGRPSVHATHLHHAPSAPKFAEPLENTRNLPHQVPLLLAHTPRHGGKPEAHETTHLNLCVPERGALRVHPVTCPTRALPMCAWSKPAATKTVRRHATIFFEK